MEGFCLKNRIVLGIAIVLILLVNLPTTNVIGERPVKNSTLDSNQIPIVNSPLDIIYVEGDTGNNITWEISDDDPSYWLVFRDGVHIDDSSWENKNETVIVDVDGLTVGNYMFMILASDNLINVTDSVLVKVLSTDIEIHAPFSIYSDSNFNDTAQSEGWIGNGSLANPFIIEKLFIEVTSFSCIGISSTTNHFIIRNCTFVGPGINNVGLGLNFDSIRNGIIENCTFTNLRMGCNTWSSSNCTWRDNTLGYLLFGFLIHFTSDCSFTDNTFQSGGISIEGNNISNWIHEISGNTIGDKPLGYFKGLSTQDIDAEDYGQVILANCSEITVYNGDFADSSTSISIGFSNFSIVHGCHMNGRGTGILLEKTYETLIENCSIIGMMLNGLVLFDTYLTTVYNCTIINIRHWGAFVLGGSNTTILETIIKNCGDAGIGIHNSPYFCLLDSNLEDNLIGLEISRCSESEISGNTFQLNDQYGIDISSFCEGSRIFGNEFASNYVGNANDDSSGTFWDDGISTGNRWDDYNGIGYYYVPGSGGAIDHYPEYVVPTHEIDIIDVDDIFYQFGTTGHEIIWYLNWTHPSMYSIFKDGIAVKEQIWDGDWITYNVDGLEAGIYNFTLRIVDEFGFTASDMVIVTVTGSTTATTDNVTPTPTSTTTNGITYVGLQEITLIISVGSTIVIIVVIVLIIRTKRGMM